MSLSIVLRVTYNNHDSSDDSGNYFASFYFLNFHVAAMYFYFERAHLFSGNVTLTHSTTNTLSHGGNLVSPRDTNLV